jgi:polyhydroxybutyrate depolymerase
MRPRPVAFAVVVLAACTSTADTPATTTATIGTTTTTTIAGTSSANDSASDSTTPPLARQQPELVVAPGPCTPTIAAGTSDHSLDRAEGRRDFVVHRPETTDGRRLPLVVDLHGTTGTPAVQEAISRFGARGIETGAWVTLTPLALGAMTAWAVPGAIPGDDLGFVEEAIVSISDAACIDPERIFATGISSGAAMSAFLGCESALFAGVAPVAGVNLVRGCEESRPVSLVAFHGTLDRYVPIEGLDGWDTAEFDDERRFFRGDLFGIVESWARRDGCATEATVTSMGPETERHEWADCVDGTKVVLYLSAGAGHTHPGASFPADTTSSVGAVAQDIDATDLIAREFGLIT